MGSSVYFYRIRKIEEELPEVADIDKTPFPESYTYVDTEKAEEWEKEFGKKCRIQYKTIDLFGTAENIFGKRPKSITYGMYGTRYIFKDSEGNVVGRLAEEEVKKYEYTKAKEVYVYRRDKISDSSSAYILDTDSGFKTFNDIMELLRKCIEYEYTDAELIRAVAKAMFVAKDDGPVYCDIS